MLRRFIRILFGLLLVLGGLVSHLIAQAKATDAGLAHFRDRVRPILLNHCVKCHGGERVKGGFDLTTREGLLHPGTEGPAVIPGKGKDSRLWKMVAHLEEPHMPQKGAKLSDEQIAAIAKWIDGGAAYDGPLVEKNSTTKPAAEVSDEDRRWWSFRPLSRAEPPKVKDEAWARTAIDRFILAKLEEKGIAPNRMAERRKLIRRASLDLIGLPPTPEELDAFLKDESPDAYEKLIERLLASPHYGERWGRHWLDLARFAESHGYEQDYDRPSAYHYRDFVIRALNEDMPFDRFVKWQIAGDELAPNQPMALMATGFLAAGTHATQITASQAEKERYDELDDMAGTVGTAFLGLTVACARCHDHKFDPIPTSDYYRMIATFTTTVRSDIDLDLEPEKYRRAKETFDAEHRPLMEARERFEKEELASKMEEWLKTGGTPRMPRWLVLAAEKVSASSGATFARQEDGSYLVSGKSDTHDVYTFTARTPLKGITGLRIEALSHKSMIKGGPGRASNGNFALSDIEVMAGAAGEKGGVVKLVNPKATFEQKGLPIAATIDEDKTSAWAVDPQFGKDHAASFEFEKPLNFEGEGTTLTIKLKFQNNDRHAFGRPRISITTTAVPITWDGESGPHEVVEVLRIVGLPMAQWTAEQRQAVLSWYRTIDAQWQKLDRAVAEHAKGEPKKNLTKVLISSEGIPAVRLHTQGPDFYEKTYLLRRGDLNQKVGEARSGFLQVLMKSPEDEAHFQAKAPAGSKLSYRRTNLANWLMDTEHGAGRLAARVIVNRLWQHHFGRGIVGTPNDFGVQGERPSHPELLDYLATELIRNGWRLKPIHKLIMTSSVYMQGSEFDEARAAVDRENRMHWRRPHRRLEAEVIRDSMLAVSGALDSTMFGPGTLDEGMRRRSIYFFVKRSSLIPLMVLFDAPEPLQGMAQRPTTTIAPQALALMNHPQVQAYAAAFAKRVKASGRSEEGMVKFAYGIALGREPTVEELNDSLSFLREYDDDSEALKLFCQALVSLNEFVFVD